MILAKANSLQNFVTFNGKKFYNIDTVITIVTYDRKTFIVEATGVVGILLGLGDAPVWQ
jgi:hypothetical protein